MGSRAIPTRILSKQVWEMIESGELSAGQKQYLISRLERVSTFLKESMNPDATVPLTPPRVPSASTASASPRRVAASNTAHSSVTRSSHPSTQKGAF